MWKKGKTRARTNPLFDILMVLFCFSGAVLGVVLFWKDMNRTLTKLSEIPVGIVSYKHNSAQRRFEDRLIWSQLQQTSPIYNGDIIRTSDLSDAAITFTNQDAIVLAENCLIQVFFSEKGARIELSGGTVNVNAKEDGLVLVSGENTVTLSAGSVISAGGDNQGFNVQVVEGNATISTRTGIQEASAGSALSVGTDGITQNPQVAVLSPLPNQQFLNASTSATPVSFSWKAINFSQDDYVRLEIAADRRFTRIIHTLDAHDTTAATVELAPGTFWWRAYATTPQEAASQQNASGSAATGRLTVLNADPPALVSPAPGAAYSYRVNPSTIRFQWSAPTGTDQEAASEYLLEAADNPEMRNPQIRTTVQGSSFVYPGLEKGNWYWRVTPLYDGSVGTPVASPQASFVIEQNTASQSAPELLVPATGSAVNISAGGRGVSFSWKDEPDADSYTIEITEDQNGQNPVLTQVVRDNFYTNRSGSLGPGQYFWRVYYTDSEGNRSPVSASRSFLALQGDMIHETLFPPDDYTVADEVLPGLRFTWTTNLPFTSRFQLSPAPDFSLLLMDTAITGTTRERGYQGVALADGTYYWRISTTTALGTGETVLQSSPKRLVVVDPLPMPELESPLGRIIPRPGEDLVFQWSLVPGADSYEVSLYEGSAEQGGSGSSGFGARGTRLVYENPGIKVNSLVVPMNSLKEGAYFWTVRALVQESPRTSRRNGPAETGQFLLRIPRPVHLEYPPLGHTVTGLDAQRRPGMVWWSAEEALGTSRFILSRNPNPLEGEPVVEVRDPSTSITLPKLSPGTYYWTIQAETVDGFAISAETPGSFQVLPVVVPPVSLDFPQTGYSFTGLNALRYPGSIRWNSTETVGSSRFILSQNPDPLQGEAVLDLRDPGRSITLPPLSPGTYYWTILAETSDGLDISAARPASFRVLPLSVSPVSLDSPVSGYRFTGLDALRQPGTVRWSSTETVGSSRFILSRNANPLQGEAVLEVRDPGRFILLPKLTEGTYYWTIQAETPDGLDISAAQPASFQVLPARATPVSLESPAARFTGLELVRRTATLRWSSTETLGKARFILSQNANPLQGEAIMDVLDPGRSVLLPKLAPGTYYWTIQAETPDGLDISAAQPGSFQVLPVETSPVSLDFPEAGHPFTGLGMVRRTATLRWSSIETVGKSRLIIAQNADPLQGEAALDMTNPSTTITLPPLAPGTYYWTIQAETPDGLDISAAQPGSFRVLPLEVPAVSLDFPASGYRFPGLEALRRPGTVRWNSTERVGTSRFILSRNPDPMQGTPVLELRDPGRSITLPQLAEGTYYWTIQAETPDGLDISAAQASSFQVLPVSVPPVRLDSPSAGYAFTGLDALRWPGTIRWSSTETVGSSRFILSRNPDPLQGEAILEVANPGKSITLPQLAEGTYYWTIQAETPDGLDISAARPSRFQVLPIPLLPQPQGMRPENGYRIDVAQVQRSRSITFTWDPVSGANAYRLTLIANTPEQRPILRTDPMRTIGYRIADLSILDVGDFIWQVEALSIALDGTVEQRGTIGENRFTIDIPSLSNPKLGVTGSLYGNDN